MGAGPAQRQVARAAADRHRLLKDYNDCYGHQAGDDCLVQVAAALRANLRRRGDLAARYGGEEFVVVAVDADLEQAHQLAQVICQAVAARALAHVRSPYGQVTASIGVAALVPSVDLAGAPELLVRRADAALYRAKAEGRNCVRLCDSMSAGQLVPS